MTTESDKVIADYNDARKASGTVGDGMAAWRYRNGWYDIGYGKYRRKQVEAMTAELLRRAQQGAKP